jgi:hypothetical protein
VNFTVLGCGLNPTLLELFCNGWLVLSGIVQIWGW